ncbi:MAG: tetratricopeptide repeat protein [Deltaproteobacteria bacterium]|nr:tetratricopeptide repeat protein [Deltaproteobacteria bacterium]
MSDEKRCEAMQGVSLKTTMEQTGSSAEILKEALCHYEDDDLETAERLCEQIWPVAPERADADHLLGLIANRRGDRRLAVELIQRAISQDGRRPIWHANLGNLFRMLKQYAQAAQALARSLALDSKDAGTANTMGLLLENMDRLPEAVEWYSRAVEGDPSDVQFHYNLADAHRRLGHVRRAILGYREVLKRSPDYIGAYVNLGNLLFHQGLVPAATVIYRKALIQFPGDHRILTNLAAAYMKMGELTRGAGCLRRAIAKEPDYASAYNNLAAIFQREGKIDEAVTCYRRSLVLDPTNRENHSNLLFALHYDPNCTPVEIRRAAEVYWNDYGPEVSLQPPAFRSQVSRRLRIGYVSADFREHSVSYFFRPLLSAHDRRRFEIFCYASIWRPDKITEALRRTSDHWRDIRLMDAGQAARAIRDDAIDILIDLGGHTAENRLDVFALQPAPVQITWLGYPGTTGLPSMAFRITDGVTDPVGVTEEHYTERLLRLPKVFLCYGPATGAPDVGPLPAQTHGAITFGSFNNLSKINAAVIGAWAGILQRVPESRLLLKARPLADEAIRRRYLTLFQERGIEADRVRMLPRTTTTAEHLACYHEVDIALDTFPYNGTTTTCEALWMGVPVVTCWGARHSARVGAAILGQVGLGHLAAEDQAGYVEAAVGLAGNLAELVSLRAGLRQRMQESPLCDAPRFARHFEAALEKIWNMTAMGKEVELKA